MKGRKPLPDNVRELRGNPGKRARTQAPVEGLPGTPEIPARLKRSKLATEKWNELVPQLEAMGVLTLADRALLELTCDLYAKFCRKGTAALAARYQSCLAEFGLTPTARARLSRPTKPHGGYGDFRKSPKP
jgi:phage terminase small subunit